MAYKILFDEPEGFAAGDRVEWKRNFAAYPISEGWSLVYYLRGNFAGGQIDISATTSGADFYVDLTPTITSNYTPGVYYWQAFVTKAAGADRKPVDSGRFVVTADYAQETQPTDGRTHARRVLDSINAVIEGRATHDQQRYVLQAVGRSVDKMPIKELLAFRDYYLTEVQAEEAAADGGKNRNVFVSFNA